jgi:dienelactone hydrolase
MKNLRCLALAVVTAGLCLPVSASAAGLKDEMRQPWQRGNTDYLRRWLILGPLDCDLPTDCLKGESEVRPVDGTEQKVAKGDAAKWRRTDSWDDTVDLGDAKDGQVAYAFATIPREKAGKARVSIGTDDGVRVWLNDKLILSRDARRRMLPDEDQLDVDFQAGDNALLVKVGARSDVAVRVLEVGATPARRFEIGPSIIEMQPEMFTVRTDATKERAGAEPVLVEVLRPGGEIRFTKSAPRGDLVVVDAKGWPDGPYEIRASTVNALGLRYTTWLPWFKGDSLAKARELEKEAAAADAAQPAGFTLKMLVEMVEDRLGMKLSEARGNPWTRIHSPLMEFEEIMLERAGKTGRVRAGGFVRLAWRDETDDTPQYCRAYLPASYDPAKKWPTILELHGFNPANPPYVRWWSADSRHTGGSEFSGNREFIYIEPHGRGNTQYIAFGNADVIRCLNEAKKSFAVDENRVYLGGTSMGGWGTWNVATRSPHLFAAIAPVFGGVDYHSEMSEEDLAKLTPIEKFLEERDSSWVQAESLNNLPIFVHHGDVDAAVNVDYSRWGVRMLQRWGYDVRYKEYPGKGHEALAWNGPLMNGEFFLKHTRDANPRQVRIRSAELRHAQAYWVRVEQRARPLEFMHVDAEIADRNVIRLDTQNVVDVVLSPAALVDASRPVKVVWNGVARDLRLEGGELRLTDPSYKPAAVRKTRALPGSINDFYNTPFAVVVGTISKDARTRDVVRLRAEAFANEWQQWQKYPPRYFVDTEISDADISKYSLILIGGAEANLVTAKLRRKLPLAIRGDTITIGDARSSKTYTAPDAGVQLLFPNPRNPARYVWVTAGTSANGLAQASPNPFQVGEWDFFIEDGHAPAFKQQLPRERTRVVSGMFDQNWRFDPAFVLPGDAQARAQGRRFRLPTGAKAASALMAELAGDYQFTPGPRVKVTTRDGKLFASTGAEDAEVQLVEALTFYVPRFMGWITFERDAAGKIAGVKGYFGQDVEGRRVE